MRIIVSSRHVKFKLICVVYVCITKLNLFDASDFKDLLQQNWIKDRIKIFANTLQ